MNISPLITRIFDNNKKYIKSESHPYLEVWTDNYGTIDVVMNIEKVKNLMSKEHERVVGLTKSLDKFEIKMLKTIAKYHPFSITEIQNAYHCLKSFDKVIKAINFSLSQGQCLSSTVRYYNQENIK